VTLSPLDDRRSESRRVFDEGVLVVLGKRSLIVDPIRVKVEDSIGDDMGGPALTACWGPLPRARQRSASGPTAAKMAPFLAAGPFSFPDRTAFFRA